MQTILDGANTWWMESLSYADDLNVLVVEGIKSETPEDLQIGDHVLEDCNPVEVTPASRYMLVRFKRVVAWQVIDESYTSADKSEVSDDNGFLSMLSSSAYLRFVEQHHGWFKDMVGPAKHYRLWTEDEVIDVVAHDEPDVQSIREPN